MHRAWCRDLRLARCNDLELTLLRRGTCYPAVGLLNVRHRCLTCHMKQIRSQDAGAAICSVCCGTSNLSVELVKFYRRQVTRNADGGRYVHAGVTS